MATLATADALIDLSYTPVRQRANIKLTQSGGLVTVANRGGIKNIIAFTEQTTQIKGGSYNNSEINFRPTASGSSLIFDNTRVYGAIVNGNDQNQGLQIGDGNRTTADSIRANLGGGNDSLVFSGRSTTSGSGFKMGLGEDSVTFAGGSIVRNTVLDLGSDSNADTVVVNQSSRVTELDIVNFGQEDTLVVGSRTYNYSDLDIINGNVSNSIKVDLVP